MVAVVVVVDVVPSYIVSSTHLSNGFPALNEIKVATLYPKYNPARILVSETATCIILYICIVSFLFLRPDLGSVRFMVCQYHHSSSQHHHHHHHPRPPLLQRIPILVVDRHTKRIQKNHVVVDITMLLLFCDMSSIF